jgi:hypothetical protein
MEEILEMMVYPPVPTLATLEVVSPVALDLKGEQMPTHATTLEVADPEAAACPTTTNSVSLNPVNPATKAGKDSSPKTSTLPTETQALEMPSRAGMHPGIGRAPPSYSTSARLPHPLLQPSHRDVPHVFPALI